MRLPKGRAVPITLLAALVAVDVVLVGAVMARRATPAGTPLPAPGVSYGPTPIGPTLPASRSATTSASAATWRALPVDVAADGTALRAIVPGSCAAGGARLQWSDSFGASWRDIPSPARRVLRVQVAGGGAAWLAGTDDRCQLRLWNTADGGRTWTLGDPAGAWSLLAQSTARQLHAPTGIVGSPCAPGAVAVDLAGLSETGAALLCSNGNVYTTQDGGATWQPVASWPGARAVAADPAGRPVVLRAGAPGCSGLELAQPVGSAPSARLACIAHVNTDIMVGIAFANTGSGLIVLGGAGTTFRTSDGGRTWRRA